MVLELRYSTGVNWKRKWCWSEVEMCENSFSDGCEL